MEVWIGVQVFAEAGKKDFINNKKKEKKKKEEEKEGVKKIPLLCN
jgi:hypothetical protein